MLHDAWRSPGGLSSLFVFAVALTRHFHTRIDSRYLDAIKKLSAARVQRIPPFVLIYQKPDFVSTMHRPISRVQVDFFEQEPRVITLILQL